MHQHDQSDPRVDPLLSGFDFTAPAIPTSARVDNFVSATPRNQHPRSSSAGSLPQHPSLPRFASTDGGGGVLHDSRFHNQFPTTPSATSQVGSIPSHPNASLFNNRPSSTFDLNGYSIPDFHTNTLRLESMQHEQFGDMLIESQDIQTSLLGLDTLPWFEMEPLPEDMGLEHYAQLGEQQNESGGAVG